MWVDALRAELPWLDADQLLPGVQLDKMAPFKPYKSIIKLRRDQMQLGAARHALECEAALRVLEALKAFYHGWTVLAH